MDHPPRPGQIVILNGTPRSGKSSIAAVIQQSFDGVWMNLGVDGFFRMTPEKYRPGIGLRPGGERPDLEPLIVTLYRAMYQSIAAHSRLGLNVVVDVGHHDSYSAPRGILPLCARELAGLPALLVGVRCPIETIRERRLATWGPGSSDDGSVPRPVALWQQAVHEPGIYDLEVDTSVLSPEACADLIRRHLTGGPPPTALRRLAVMTDTQALAPDSTAARVAMWRALHVEIDPPPHILEDQIGLKLLAPDEDWRRRGDMDPRFTRTFRASIVARARFIEDLVTDQAGFSLTQYVILGAGLDSFAQRRPEIASHLTVFEIDQPGPQAWKQQRLIELGFGVPDWLRFVPVDFEAGGSWWDRLAAAGFDASRPAIFASTGVSMYLTRDANVAMLRQVAALAPGSTLAMSFLLPLELAGPEVRPGLKLAAKGASASGTPFISFFTPSEMLALAHNAGFSEARHVSAADLTARYFAGRSDGLHPPENAEELLVATT